MSKITFSEDELKVIREIPAYRRPDLPNIPIFDFPVKPKEAYHAFFKKEPVWQLTGVEISRFCPAVYPDNVARGYIIEENPLPIEEWGGTDIFGVEWCYDEDNRGSAVVPGAPLFTDANSWEETLVWPDINSWDWAGSAGENKDYLSGDNAMVPVIMNGYFERLVTFMDFGNAAIALIDDSQKEAVKSLFDKLSDLYIKVVDKFIDYFDVDGFIFHDDWGSQGAPLFSVDTAAEMIVPAMKKLTAHIKKRGRVAELHSCGSLDSQVSNMIEAGWDSWSPQAINDTHEIYEKYGEEIIIGVIPDSFPPDASEERQREEASKFAEKFCDPKKPAFLSIYGASVVTPAYREELYRLSRQRYLDA